MNEKIKIDDNYLKNHLATYIEFQLGNGYELKDIKEALIQYGYSGGLISDISNQFKNRTPAKILDNFTKKDKEMIKDDLVIYVENMLIDYIKKQLDLGFSLQAIKKALKHQGNSQQLIDKASMTIKKGEYVDYKKAQQIKQYPISLLFFLMLIIVITLIFIISIATNENLLLVFLTFAPALLGLILLYILITYVSLQLVIQITPIIVVLFTIGLFMYVDYATTLYKGTDKNILLTLNILFSFISASVLTLFSKKNIPKQKEQNNGNKTHELNKQHHSAENHNEHHNNEHYGGAKEVILDDDDIKAHSSDALKIKEIIYKKQEQNKKIDNNNEKKKKLKLKEFLP